MNRRVHTNLTRTSFFLFIFFCTCAAEAKGPTKGSPNKPVDPSAKAASCSPATHQVNLEFNHVRALIETGGNMWMDRAVNNAAYEVPKTSDNSGAKAIFAGSLWMGGRSPDNQIKLAAVTFRADGNDYWPGPLTTDGAGTVDGEVCQAFYRSWKVNRQEVELHRAYHLCLNDPDCDEATEFPG